MAVANARHKPGPAPAETFLDAVRTLKTPLTASGAATEDTLVQEPTVGLTDLLDESILPKFTQQPLSVRMDIFGRLADSDPQFHATRPAVRHRLYKLLLPELLEDGASDTSTAAAVPPTPAAAPQTPPEVPPATQGAPGPFGALVGALTGTQRLPGQAGQPPEGTDPVDLATRHAQSVRGVRPPATAATPPSGPQIPATQGAPGPGAALLGAITGSQRLPGQAGQPPEGTDPAALATRAAQQAPTQMTNAAIDALPPGLQGAAESTVGVAQMVGQAGVKAVNQFPNLAALAGRYPLQGVQAVGTALRVVPDAARIAPEQFKRIEDRLTNPLEKALAGEEGFTKSESPVVRTVQTVLDTAVGTAAFAGLGGQFVKVLAETPMSAQVVNALKGLTAETVAEYAISDNPWVKLAANLVGSGLPPSDVKRAMRAFVDRKALQRFVARTVKEEGNDLASLERGDEITRIINEAQQTAPYKPTLGEQVGYSPSLSGSVADIRQGNPGINTQARLTDEGNRAAFTAALENQLPDTTTAATRLDDLGQRTAQEVETARAQADAAAARAAATKVQGRNAVEAAHEARLQQLREAQDMLAALKHKAEQAALARQQQLLAPVEQAAEDARTSVERARARAAVLNRQSQAVDDAERGAAQQALHRAQHEQATSLETLNRHQQALNKTVDAAHKDLTDLAALDAAGKPAYVAAEVAANKQQAVAQHIRQNYKRLDDDLDEWAKGAYAEFREATDVTSPAAPLIAILDAVEAETITRVQGRFSPTAVLSNVRKKIDQLADTQGQKDPKKAILTLDDARVIRSELLKDARKTFSGEQRTILQNIAGHVDKLMDDMADKAGRTDLRTRLKETNAEYRRRTLVVDEGPGAAALATTPRGLLKYTYGDLIKFFLRPGPTAAHPGRNTKAVEHFKTLLADADDVPGLKDGIRSLFLDDYYQTAMVVEKGQKVFKPDKALQWIEDHKAYFDASDDLARAFLANKVDTAGNPVRLSVRELAHLTQQAEAETGGMVARLERGVQAASDRAKETARAAKEADAVRRQGAADDLKRTRAQERAARAELQATKQTVAQENQQAIEAQVRPAQDAYKQLRDESADTLRTTRRETRAAAEQAAADAEQAKEALKRAEANYELTFAKSAAANRALTDQGFLDRTGKTPYDAIADIEALDNARTKAAAYARLMAQATPDEKTAIFRARYDAWKTTKSRATESTLLNTPTSLVDPTAFRTFLTENRAFLQQHMPDYYRDISTVYDAVDEGLKRHILASSGKASDVPRKMKLDTPGEKMRDAFLTSIGFRAFAGTSYIWSAVFGHGVYFLEDLSNSAKLQMLERIHFDPATTKVFALMTNPKADKTYIRTMLTSALSRAGVLTTRAQDDDPY